MGDKDKVEKILLNFNDVFADILNVLLFKGEEVVTSKDLRDALPKSMYKANDNFHELERDVAKYWKPGKVQFALYGMENQTAPEDDMSLRMAGYDGISYRKQLLDDKPKKKKIRYPVISLVLYYGYKKRWDKARKISERVPIDKRLRPYFKEYEINLFEIAYLDDETAKLFKSDFRFVVDFFIQMRKTGKYFPTEGNVEPKHIYEILQLMSVMTKDARFEQAYTRSKAGEVKTMCDVVDKIEQDGADKKEREYLISMFQEGLPIQTIAKIAKKSVKEMEKFRKQFVTAGLL